MFNFSGITRSGLMGRVLRLPLGLIPKSAVLWILQGNLRGYRWISGASTHGCWLGSYELQKQRRFATAVKVSDTVYDIGANVGFYTLLASACVGPTGRVFSFEPVPENITLLEKHVRLNRCANVSVHPVAVSRKAGKLRFERGARCETGKLSELGDLEVAVVSLDEFIYNQGNPFPNVIKIDVEGAELEVLAGARKLLTSNPPIIFLATHSPQLHAACCELLQSAGYRLEGIEGTGTAANQTDELICFPAERCVSRLSSPT